MPSLISQQKYDDVLDMEDSIGKSIILTWSSTETIRFKNKTALPSPEFLTPFYI